MKNNDETLTVDTNENYNLNEPLFYSIDEIKFNDTENYIIKLMKDYGRDEDYIMQHVIFDEYPWDYKYIIQLINEIGLDEERILNRIIDEEQLDKWKEITQEQIYMTISIIKGLYKGGIHEKLHFKDGGVRAIFQLSIEEKTRINEKDETEKFYQGRKNGYYTIYHETGQLMKRGFYRDDVSVDLFEEYNVNGELIKKINYKYGLDKSICEL